MSIAQLFIGYAHKSCNTEQVKEAFENALNEDGIVARVDFRTKKNDRGEDFFVFFIHFDHENRQLQHMHAEIAKHGFVTLVYAREWDRRRNAYVERYWKVLAYKQKEVTAPAEFVPRLMSLEEASAAGISAPKKPAKALPAYLAAKVAAEAPLTNLEMAQVIQSETKKILPLNLEAALDAAWAKAAEPTDGWSESIDFGEAPPPPVLRRTETYASEPELTEAEKAQANALAAQLVKKHVEFTLIEPSGKERRKAEKRPRLENSFAALSIDEKPDPLDDANWEGIGQPVA